MRGPIAIAWGALASGGAALLLPGVERSALRATLAALPLAVALLGAAGAALGARRTSNGERLLGAAWLALALHAEELGVPFAGESLAAALALLLGWRVARLLPALLRSRARGGPRWPFAALPFAVGVALLPWIHRAAPPNGDEPYVLLLAESLVSDGDFDLADEYRDGVARRFTARPIAPQPGDPVDARGGQRSRHESLLVVVLAPFWKLGGAGGARLAMVALWALLAERLFALLLAAGIATRGAVRAFALSTFAPPLALFAPQIWIEVPAALAVAVALERWARLRGARESAGRDEAAFAAALVVLPLLKLRLLALALPLLLARLAERRRRGAALLGAGALAALVGLVLERNRRLTGSVLGVYELDDLLAFEIAPTTALLRLDGLLFDLAFGLLAAGPLWLLALGSLPALRARAGLFRRALGAALPYLGLLVAVRIWYGGWCPPFRYGIVLVPLLALALGAALARRAGRAERLLGWTLGLATALLGLATAVEPGWATSFADGRSRLLDLAAAPFAADLARLLPSAVRPRAATFVAPLLALALLALARRARGRRLPAPELGGAACLLALALAGLAAAHFVPTRVAEAEDPWVNRGAGELYPDRWTVDRTLVPGGRTLAAGGAPLVVRPVAGGARARITLRYRIHAESGDRALFLAALEGSGEIRRRTLGPRGSWTTETLPERAWRAGEALVLSVLPAASDRLDAAVVVDRVEFSWR
jgi:hypothetical protein